MANREIGSGFLLKMFVKISRKISQDFHYKVAVFQVSLTSAVWLAQSGECRSAEREVAGSNPGRSSTWVL